MNKVQKIALAYLVFLLLVIYGYAIGRFQVFPHSIIEPFVQNFLEFAEGDAMEKKTSVVDKMKNDLGLAAARWTYPYPDLAAMKTMESPFPDLVSRKDPPLVFVDKAHQEGFRVVYGALELQDSFWGAILLDPAGQIIHSWALSTEHLPAEAKVDELKNLYGVHLFPDGSIIYVMQERGGGIVKVDACNNIRWNLEGEFHHVVSPDEDGTFWSFIGLQHTRDQDMVRVSIETGEILSRINMKDVREANPDIHAWDFYKFSFADRTATYKNADMSHGNDIEPLPQHLAADFPGFSPGDLAISYATSNLLFVLDPKTLKVKWWRVGVSDLQHDTDWEAGGTISVFSNNPRSGRWISDIVTIDPKTMEHERTVKGEDYSFFSMINGRHQLTDYGTRFVTSSQQGWAFEVDSAGDIVFSFLNNVDSKEKKAMHLSEAVRLSEDYFDSYFWETCN